MTRRATSLDVASSGYLSSSALTTALISATDGGILLLGSELSEAFLDVLQITLVMHERLVVEVAIDAGKHLLPGVVVRLLPSVALAVVLEILTAGKEVPGHASARHVEVPPDVLQEGLRRDEHWHGQGLPFL